MMQPIYAMNVRDKRDPFIFTFIWDKANNFSFAVSASVLST